MKKLWNSWAGILVLALILLFIGGGLGDAAVEALAGTSLGASPVWQTMSGYIAFLSIWIAVLLYCGLAKDDRWLLPLLGKGAKGNTVPMLLLGLLIGFLLNGACILAASLNGDFVLEARSVSVPAILGIFLCVFVQSSAEELICRHVIYRKLDRRYGKVLIAVLGNAVPFAAMHLFNHGITVLSVVNLLLCGVMMSLFVWVTDSLWVVFGIHTMWNFTQNIIFGLPNSGSMVPYSVFGMTGSAKNSFAYSTGFGIEGGLMCCLLFAAVCAGLCFAGRRQGKKLL